MWQTVLGILSIVGAFIASNFFSKSKGESNERQKQQKIENKNMQDNIQINKEVGVMGFSAKSNFLLSKQRNKNIK